MTSMDVILILKGYAWTLPLKERASKTKDATNITSQEQCISPTILSEGASQVEDVTTLTSEEERVSTVFPKGLPMRLNDLMSVTEKEDRMRTTVLILRLSQLKCMKCVAGRSWSVERKRNKRKNNATGKKNAVGKNRNALRS